MGDHEREPGAARHTWKWWKPAGCPALAGFGDEPAGLLELAKLRFGDRGATVVGPLLLEPIARQLERFPPTLIAVVDKEHAKLFAAVLDEVYFPLEQVLRGRGKKRNKAGGRRRRSNQRKADNRARKSNFRARPRRIGREVQLRGLVQTDLRCPVRNRHAQAARAPDASAASEAPGWRDTCRRPSTHQSCNTSCGTSSNSRGRLAPRAELPPEAGRL